MRLKNLPRQITRFQTKEEILELQHLKNVVIYNFELGNLLFNALKAEKKAKQDLDNIPW